MSAWTTLKQRCAGSWRPKPMAAWEFLVMRAAFALLVFWKLPTQLGFTQQLEPNGLAHWIDFTWLGQPAVYTATKAVMVVAAVVYVIGWQLAFSTSVLALGHLSICTLINSQGYVRHDFQIISQILLAQAFTAVWLAIASRRGRGVPGAEKGLSAASWMVYFTQGVVVAGYVTSAVTKLIRSNGRWLLDLPNTPLALLRTQMQAYYTDPVGAPPALPPLAVWFLEHPTLTTLLFAPGLFLELFAFLALRNRGSSLAMGLGLIALHRGIAIIMELYFPMNELVLLIFFVNVPYWAWFLAKRLNSPAAKKT